MPSQEDHNIYEQIPYPGGLCYAQTHPNRIAAIAMLLGLTPPPVMHCRVLELGCADGGNLIPMAQSLPESEFVGIDYTARHIEDAQNIAELMALNNIRLEQRNIMEIGPDFGEFDYIIVHGIYSWVPEPVREQILTICKRNLSPNGIAYVSYNVYPGWHVTDAARNMMLYRTRNTKDPHEVITQARELIEFLDEAVSGEEKRDNNFIKAFLHSAQERWQYYQTISTTMILHDDLSEINQPFYFYQFIDAAARHGLQFLSEATFSESLPNNFPPNIAHQLRMMSADVIEMEQYMDFLRTNSFRRTLLCHQGLEIQREINPDPASLGAFYISMRAPLTGEDIHDDDGAFANHLPIVRAALSYLAEIVPQAVSFEKLLAEARRRTEDALAGTANLIPVGETRVAGDITFGKANDEDARELAVSMVNAFGAIIQLVDFNIYAPALAPEVSERPVASRLARYHAERGANTVPNLRHERITLDPLSLHLLPYMDGQHNYQELLSILEGMADDGLIEMADEDDQPVTDPAQIHDMLVKILDQRLPSIAHVALLVA